MAVKNWCGLVALAALGMSAGGATASHKQTVRVPAPPPGSPAACVILDTPRTGRLVDYTQNHQADRRIWSRSLYQKRDLYVYLPPGYDPGQSYPLIIFLHGFAYDERMFLQVLPYLDQAMATGKLPPAIIAAPDGTLDGYGCLEKPGSFFINSRAGIYEDFVVCDVYDFMTANYPIRPEREAHVLAGVSMGGYGAFTLGIRHRNQFGVVVGIFPPLNLRWADCDLNPRAKFDPRRWGWRLHFDNPNEVLARVGPKKIRVRDMVEPVFGLGDEGIQAAMENNPIEMIDRCRLKNGELQMFVAYGCKDEFNIDAQVESFLYLCKYRGLYVGVAYDPNGHHDAATAARFVPPLVDWLAPRLGPYSPGLIGGAGAAGCSEACQPTRIP
jgi:S-formylglutathione hydrolase FrmB